MEELRISSPNGRIAFVLLPNAERLTFLATLDGVPAIEPSPLRMELDGYDLSAGVALGAVDRYQIDETYPWMGAHDPAVNRCNGARVSLTNDLSYISYTLEIRVFDDGVAYRHRVPGADGTPRVPDEHSSFVLPAGSTVWYGGLVGGHYEADYRKASIDDVRPGEWSGPPLTFRLPDQAGYGSITEADLVEYSGMGLESDGRRAWTIGLGHRQPLNYPFELRYGREEARRLGRPAAIEGTITTPWRAVLLGRDLNALVNSTLVPNLCPPPDPAIFPEGIRADWIRPGRAVWRYLDGGPTGVDGMKEFSRMAGQLGFEYQVVEGFWSRWSMEQRRDVVDFSRKRGVGLLFWKHSKDLRTPEAQEAFFSMLGELGVTGAKIDFFDHEAKEIVDLYESLLRKAAEHHVLLVFHGANKPSGRARTWPNEMVREAVRGMESSRLKERARHETILPFTRLLAGPADYTALMFGPRRGDTTWAHQIATLAVFASPLLTIAANPKSILENPAVDVIQGIPPVWDETRVIPESEIGELAGFARRKGDTWYLAVLCGPHGRSLRVPLGFLSDATPYRTRLVRDRTGDPAAVDMEDGVATAKDTLTIDMPDGGGFLGRYTPRAGSNSHDRDAER